MSVIRKIFYGSRTTQYRIVPVGDVHIGARGCDEELLRTVVKSIQETENAYWIGMGDMCEFINVGDRRFDAEMLANWIDVADLVDLARVQVERFVDIMSPVADKCLCLLEGNHERAIRRHTERDVYREIVSRIKGAGGFKSTEPLALGFTGWLQLLFRRTKEGERPAGTKIINMHLHHGFVGGRLAGGKALNMQRWLWTHNADLCLWGHSHNTGIQPEAVERIDSRGNVHTVTRRGAFTGTFLHSGGHKKGSSYAEIKGYFPLPVGGVLIELRPGIDRGSGIRLVYEG